MLSCSGNRPKKQKAPVSLRYRDEKSCYHSASPCPYGKSLIGHPDRCPAISRSHPAYPTEFSTQLPECIPFFSRQCLAPTDNSLKLGKKKLLLSDPRFYGVILHLSNHFVKYKFCEIRGALRPLANRANSYAKVNRRDTRAGWNRLPKARLRFHSWRCGRSPKHRRGQQWKAPSLHSVPPAAPWFPHFLPAESYQK